MRPTPGVIASLLAASLELLLSAPSGAQSAHAGLLGFLAQRPLLARLDLADAVAIASVERVELGRVHLRDAEVLFGSVPGSFELKRAPSNPPPLAPGERALLLLRGARSPYLLVDAPAELRKLPDAAAVGLWRGAVLALLEKRGDPALLELYLAWLDPAAPDLARAAVLGLDDPTAPYQPLPATALLRLARFAGDARAELELRRAAHFLVGRSLADQGELLARNRELRDALERIGAELR
jgi:hypothetical protein